MPTILIILTVIGFTIAANIFISAFWNHNQRNKMKKKESDLRKAGITPYGSTLSHGMCIDTRTNKLISDQKESIMWYKRLI
ncbi:hypothetical protein BCU84_10925 [Shewanella sp. 10N.286.51.B7]|uniref:hypothetical protein n=1 Tax=Shewanella sp. 10N.286.51.B7 TaxID=1880836 RepID=UPI000C81D16A|nr:hypothetical protein [Shewanella sp. 10N.286.51.B7]PMG77315.1 hypothetical protein BCU84_10925 [Shewanella sp. 10N.286.51.B7]